MLIVMQNSATESQVDQVCQAVAELGFEAHKMPGAQRTAICITGNDGSISERHFMGLSGIREVIRVSKPYKLTSNETKTTPTVVSVGQGKFGGDHFGVIAGPACVEEAELTLEMARQLQQAGVDVFRAAAYRSRSNPYHYRGLGEDALPVLQKIKDKLNMPIATEVIDTESVAKAKEVADILIVESHNMQHFTLLRALGKVKQPVILKRGIAATIEDFLMAAEYILAGGNHQVILCEAGVQSFTQHGAHLLDVEVVPALKQLTHLPVIVDPSQAAGTPMMVTPLTRAAAALGSHGVMVECHSLPAQSAIGGSHAITIDEMVSIMPVLKQLRQVLPHESR